MRPWAGMIARLDVPTVDGRTLLRAYWLPPMPLMSAKHQTPIGTVDGLRMVAEGFERAICAVGWLTTWDGMEDNYSVGIDLTDVEPDGVLPSDGTGIVIAGGQIRALTVYDDGVSQPAWPDCHIQILV